VEDLQYAIFTAEEAEHRVRTRNLGRWLILQQVDSLSPGTRTFVLACDMRFASRENLLLGQPEVGVGVNPGGGGTERLPRLVGRGRALEIVLGANDFDGETAERYGYINRALPDAELDGFVDALARRIASFDRRPISAAKNLINQVSLPSADRLLDALKSFQIALTWPETQQRIQALFKRGLQKEVDFEKHWADLLGTLFEK
jgi:enoyl-CoA hydratase/carnithine racemase